MIEIAFSLLGTILLITAFRKKIYVIFLIVLLMTEFLYINVGGGVARPYHFLAVLIVGTLAKHVHQLFSSRVFLALLSLVAINLFTVALSSEPGKALASFTSFLANICVALATASVLLSGKLDVVRVKRLILIVTLVSVAWGLLQITAFRLGGLNLGISLEQQEQVAAGFGPGFRTEANTFGKYLAVPFFLLLPDYLERRGSRIGLLFLVLLVGVLMNFTRTALYGMVAAFVFVALWSAHQRKLTRFTLRGGRLVASVVIGLILMLAGVVGGSDYAIYKIENFFDQAELVGGGSSAYRLEAMQTVLNAAMSTVKLLIIGNGWGQTYTFVQGVRVQAGGGDIINFLGYSGLVGVIAYLILMLKVFRAAKRAALFDANLERARFAEGVMYAVVSVFVTAQMSGYLIAPEFWMLIGFCIYLDKINSSRAVNQFAMKVVS